MTTGLRSPQEVRRKSHASALPRPEAGWGVFLVAGAYQGGPQESLCRRPLDRRPESVLAKTLAYDRQRFLCFGKSDLILNNKPTPNHWVESQGFG